MTMNVNHLYQTASHPLTEYWKELKDGVVDDLGDFGLKKEKSFFTLLSYTLIPIVGPILLNHRRNCLNEEITKELHGSKITLIRKRETADQVFAAAIVIQCLVASIFPAIIFNIAWFPPVVVFGGYLFVHYSQIKSHQLSKLQLNEKNNEKSEEI